SFGMVGVTGANLINQGYINVAVTDNATHNAWGMAVDNDSTLSNNGTITLTGNNNNVDGRAGGYAIVSYSSGTVTNAGNIFIGGTPVISEVNPTAVNLVGSGDLSAGMYSTGRGEMINTANGNVTLLEKTRNAAGMLINGGTESVTNFGQINVLGELTTASDGQLYAAANYGMYVKDNDGTVTNAGNIFVNGDNNIALNVLAQETNAS
ncbi:hypothetical protein ACQEMD_004728, partial [Salmonella enterica]